VRVETIRTATQLAEIPRDIRGYEDLKAKSIDAAKTKAEGLMLELRGPASSSLSA